MQSNECEAMTTRITITLTLTLSGPGFEATYQTTTDTDALTTADVLCDLMRKCPLMTDCRVLGDDGEDYDVTGTEIQDMRTGAYERGAA